MRTTVTGAKQPIDQLTVVDSMMEYIVRHIRFSEKAFGPGPRREGVLKHIEKEIAEVRRAAKEVDANVAAHDCFLEWIDIIILGIDGAQRELGERALHDKAGLIIQALFEKQAINKAREWPNHGDPNEPVEHDRSKDAKTGGK